MSTAYYNNNGFGGPPPARRGVRYAWFGEAWQMMIAQPAAWFVSVLIMLIIIYALSIGLSYVAQASGLMVKPQEPAPPGDVVRSVFLTVLLYRSGPDLPRRDRHADSAGNGEPIRVRAAVPRCSRNAAARRLAACPRHIPAKPSGRARQRPRSVICCRGHDAAVAKRSD